MAATERAPADDGDAFAGHDFEILEAPADSTERLRRYRIIGSHGREEMVSRAELDTRRERRRRGEQRRERAARRRRALAIGLAVVPLLVVAVVVATTLTSCEGTTTGTSPTLTGRGAPAVTQVAAPQPAAPVAPAAVVAPDASDPLRPASSVERPEAVSQAPPEVEPTIAAAVPADAQPVDAPVPQASVPAATPLRAEDAGSAEAADVRSPPRPDAVPTRQSSTRLRPRAAEWRLHADTQRAIERWLASWRSQDVDGYLRSYVPGFSRWGLSPEGWQRARRNRLTSVPWIEVEIEELRIEPTGPTMRASNSSSVIVIPATPTPARRR